MALLNFTVISALRETSAAPEAGVLFTSSVGVFPGSPLMRVPLITTSLILLDPLADKLLVTAVLISLVEMGKLDSWIAVVIISREFAVTGLRQIALLDGSVVAASAWGKLKTVVQIVAIVLLLLNNFPFSFTGIHMDVIAVWAAAIITIWSGIDYFIKNKNLLHLSKA